MPTIVEETEKIETGKDKKNNLLLNSLQIKGYRCFENLTIERLGQVNLIVGKNNVGKTALLEALWIYANHDNSSVLHEIVFNRNEITDERTSSHESIREYNSAVKNLFYNRPTIPNRSHKATDSPYFIISEAGRDLEHFTDKFLNPDKSEDIKKREFNEAFLRSAASKTTFVRCYHESGFGMPNVIYDPQIERDIKNLFISSTGLSNEDLVKFWDVITLTPLEDEVIEALYLLLPNLNRISFIGYPKGAKNRVPVIQVKNGKEPLPLKSYGEGMTRLLGLSLALVQCQNGMLFIDEIESGLHYSVLPSVWRLIFKTAKELNVQVFATTHSYDCIDAFAQASIEDEESDGMLIRLARNEDQIKAFTFDEKQLETITEEKIEVR